MPQQYLSRFGPECAESDAGLTKGGSKNKTKNSNKNSNKNLRKNSNKNTKKGGSLASQEAFGKRYCPINGDLPTQSNTVQKGGAAGYTTNVNDMIAGMPAIDKYSTCCPPNIQGGIVPVEGNCGGSMTGGAKKKKTTSKKIVPKKTNTSSTKKTASKKKKTSTAKKTSVKDSGLVKAVRKSFDDILRMLKTSSKKMKGGAQEGGSLLTKPLQLLGTLLAPLGKERLASMVVLLALNRLMMVGGSSHDEMNYNSHGGFMKTLMVMPKTDLLVLAALLLVDHLVNKKSSQKGGFMTAELSKLLAPLGTTALTSTALVVALNDIFSKSEKSKKMRGGNPMLGELSSALTGINMNMSLVALVLFLLNEMVVTKKSRTTKGGTMQLSSLVTQLQHLLAPYGATSLITTGTLVGVSQLGKKKSKK